MTQHQVLIAGGGPTGLMLAAELALAGTDAAIVERRPAQQLIGARAGGLHARTLEVFDQRGIVDRFLAKGTPHKIALSFNHTFLDTSDLPSRHNYYLALWQQQTEQILADWVHELGIPVYRGLEVQGFSRTPTHFDIALSNNTSLQAQYLVGCDGGRSLIRKTAGIDFAGWDPTKSWLIAELDYTQEPAWGFREDSIGEHAVAKMEDGKRMRVVLTEPRLNSGSEPTLADLCQAMQSVFGTDFGAHHPTAISRFNDAARQAVAYRDRRVLLAGDAAHIHPPMGGHGLNIGVQDAVNLGWKLAQVVNGISPETLLDTYHAERHPVAARILRGTLGHVALQRFDDRTKALRETLSDLVKLDDVRRHVVAENTGLNIRYNLGDNHPLVGRRIPDLDLTTTACQTRLFHFLHRARPLLLNFGKPGALPIQPWSDRVQSIDAQYTGEWQLPAVGTVPAPEAVLVRPDGYVAWVGDSTQQGLAEALTTWFGAPAHG